MDNILNALLVQLGEGGLEQMAKKAGVETSQVTQVLNQAVPTLLNKISLNTNHENGASGFLSALDSDHDGSILDDIGSFFQNPEMANGNGILSHILGDKREVLEGKLSEQAGINNNGVSKILEMAAPLIMGLLGKQRKEGNNGFDLSDISSVIGSLSGGKGIDLSDIFQMAGGTKGNSGGILGMLGKLFGNKSSR